MTLSETLNSIIEWYRSYVPDPSGQIIFRPGLSASAVEEYQRKFGKKFPEDLIELYRFGDGMEQGWLLYRTPEIMRLGQSITLSHENWIESEAQAGLYYRSQIEIPGVSRAVWRPGWLPITDNSGNYKIVDMDPEPGGTYGQVVLYARDEAGVVERESTSLSDYFERLLLELNEGKHEWTGGELEPVAWRNA